MAITSVKTGSSFTNLQKYDNFLGPNSAYNPSSFESIATITPSGTNTVTFSSIPGTYKSLQIRGICTDAGQNTLLMRFNGITTASYASHEIAGDGATAVASGGSSQLNMQIAGRNNGLSANASYLAGVIIDIHDYASTTKNKTVRCFNGYDANGTGNIGLDSGLFASTSAVTSVTLYIGSNFSSGTTFALYGIN